MGIVDLKWHNMYSKKSLVLSNQIEYLLSGKNINLLDIEKEYIKALSEYDIEALLDNIAFFDFIYTTKNKNESGAISEQILLSLLALKKQLETKGNDTSALEDAIRLSKVRIYSIMLEESVKYTRLWKLYKFQTIEYNELLKNYVESIESSHKSRTDYSILNRGQ